MGCQQAMLMAGMAGSVPLGASVSPAGAYGSREGAGVVTSSAVTCTASGGSGTGYTYTWTRVSGDTFTVTSVGASSTTFSKSMGGTPLVTTAIYKCVVDDSLGNGPVDSNTFEIALEVL